MTGYMLQMTKEPMDEAKCNRGRECSSVNITSQVCPLCILYMSVIYHTCHQLEGYLTTAVYIGHNMHVWMHVYAFHGIHGSIMITVHAMHSSLYPRTSTNTNVRITIH